MPGTGVGLQRALEATRYRQRLLRNCGYRPRQDNFTAYCLTGGLSYELDFHHKFILLVLEAQHA